MLEYALLAGLIFGLYFSMVGLGLNLVFGVMRIVNLAHGGFIVLGAFAAFWLYRVARLNPIGSALLVFVVFAVLGAPLYYALVRRLMRARDPERLSIILFFGLAQVIEALCAIAFGPNERSIPATALAAGPTKILGQSFPGSWTASSIASATAVGFVYLYLYRTRLGYLTRAVMDSREEAVSTGIDVHRVSAVAFGVGLGLAGTAGVFAPFMLGGFGPAMGVELNVQSFAVIVVGSLGSPLGTILGGMVYGVSLMLTQTYLSSWSNLLPYALLILILLIRPSGLLGRRVRDA